MTTAIDTFVKKFGYAICGTGARYREDSVVVALAFSVEAAENFIDKFVSGDAVNTLAENFIVENPDYPVAFGDTWHEAFLRIEEKLQQRSPEDIFEAGSEWHQSINNRLSDFLYGSED